MRHIGKQLGRAGGSCFWFREGNICHLINIYIFLFLVQCRSQRLSVKTIWKLSKRINMILFATLGKRSGKCQLVQKTNAMEFLCK